MKLLKHFSYLLLLIVFLAGCKKDKLSDHYSDLVGSWISISTIFNCGVNAGTPNNPEYSLVIKKQGRYKLLHAGKKVETGRMFIENEMITFVCNEKKSVLNNQKIENFTTNSIDIGQNACNDYELRFVK